MPYTRWLFIIVLIPLLQACLTKEKLSTLADAENQVITQSGRHFVTSAEGISEIKKTHWGYSVETTKTECDEINGIESLENWLIAVCADSSLFSPVHSLIKINIQDPYNPIISHLIDLPGVALPNGIVLTPSKQSLLIADFNLFGKGKISKIDLSLSDDLKAVGYSENFIGNTDGIYSPNGLKFLNNDLYLTDFNTWGLQGRIVKLSFSEADASTKSITDIQIIHRGLSLYDDLLPTCDGILAADFLNGRLVFINSDGDVHKSKLQQFPGISSMLWGSERMFEKNTLIITEKGILKDRVSSIGNQISLAPITSNVLSRVSAQCSD